MARIRILVAATCCLIGVALATPAQATEVGNRRTFGLGFAIGDPTGVVGKLYSSPTQALDFGLSFASYGYRGNCWYDGRRHRCSRYGHTSVNVDYLWQENILRQGNLKLDWHIGVGGRIWLFDFNDEDDDGFGLSARAPIGIDLMFRRPEFLEVFLEITPSMYLLPGTFFGAEVALGVRFYF